VCAEQISGRDPRAGWAGLICLRQRARGNDGKAMHRINSSPVFPRYGKCRLLQRARQWATATSKPDLGFYKPIGGARLVGIPGYKSPATKTKRLDCRPSLRFRSDAVFRSDTGSAPQNCLKSTGYGLVEDVVVDFTQDVATIRLATQKCADTFVNRRPQDDSCLN